MPTKKKLGLNDIFPVAEANTVTDAALARAFPQIEEQALDKLRGQPGLRDKVADYIAA